MPTDLPEPAWLTANEARTRHWVVVFVVMLLLTVFCVYMATDDAWWALAVLFGLVALQAIAVTTIGAIGQIADSISDTFDELLEALKKQSEDRS